MRRTTRIGLMAALLAGVATVTLSAPPAVSTPVATSEETYQLFGRVFPDPQGCTRGAPASSPFAKGNVCAQDFLQFKELQDGLAFLESKFPDFVEIYVLHEDFACDGSRVNDPSKACKEFRSAGLPVTASESGPLTRDRRPLYLVRITDETVPNEDKEHFVFPLSIHGIERAGVEGGTRAAEDLATWAACERDAEVANCEAEDPIPHPLLEATPNKSITAGEALRKSVVYFIYPNPDGWMRGERTTGPQFFQRYNGNGVDLNRDWPTQGYTFRPYTPWSEPESAAFGKVLQAIGPKDANGDPMWTGGIDLHGQLIDRAFSFTLVGGQQRPYDKNQRVLQTVKGAWADAEERLSWSPLIKPNDAPPQPDDPRVYGVQWGTVWDSIDYTVTGALGDWIDSPLGLNGDGIDNEMSLSHVSNCGVGTCWSSDVEQLHVDGNKSLIYSMINYSLQPEDTTFQTQGRVGYLYNRGALVAKDEHLAAPPRYARLDPQADIDGATLDPSNSYTHEFKVKGPRRNVYNGGIGVTITCANAQGVGPCALSEARLERQKPAEPNTQGEEWETVNSYFNQSPLYVQAGQALHANLPTPGRYRVRIEGGETAGVFTADIDFTREKAWPDPGQIGYRATNMEFWKQLKKFASPGIERLRPRALAKRNLMRRFDTIVVTNEVYPRYAGKLKAWVARFDGNLVLTDRATKLLETMGFVDGGVDSQKFYAGYINFATSKRDVTYKDPLARNIDQPGAAEGQSGDEIHRRQTYEPVPLGMAIQKPDGSDAFNAPVWFVREASWSKAEGSQRAVGTTGSTDNVSYGEIRYRGGRVRFIGALLPMPTDEFDHPYGLADYALTYSGYQLLQNALTWKR